HMPCHSFAKALARANSFKHLHTSVFACDRYGTSVIAAIGYRTNFYDLDGEFTDSTTPFKIIARLIVAFWHHAVSRISFSRRMVCVRLSRPNNLCQASPHNNNLGRACNGRRNDQEIDGQGFWIHQHGEGQGLILPFEESSG